MSFLVCISFHVAGNKKLSKDSVSCNKKLAEAQYSKVVIKRLVTWIATIVTTPLDYCLVSRCAQTHICEGEWLAYLVIKDTIQCELNSLHQPLWHSTKRCSQFLQQERDELPHKSAVIIYVVAPTHAPNHSMNYTLQTPHHKLAV